MGRDMRTSAASSGVKLHARTVRDLAHRSDRPGLIYLTQWLVLLAGTGTLVLLSTETWWLLILAMLAHGILLSVPSYAMSHETAHGTAFKTRWLNEAVLWVTSLIYVEEPLHRRYTHTQHHSYTWHVGKDSQMPFDTPMDFTGWLVEISGIGLARFHGHVLWQLATKRYSETMMMAVPEELLPRMTLNARIMIVLYAVILAAPVLGIWWPLWLLVIPRLLGAPVMLLFTLVQHVELQENSPSIVESTRSFTTGPIGRFLYMHMNNHVEHHLYPQVPFHQLPALATALKDHVPTPDRGFFQTNWEVLGVVWRRSMGQSTKAPTIRQAPHMITEGGPVTRVARRTM